MEGYQYLSVITFPARILRGTRIAARLGFTISKETAHFLKNLSFLVQRLHRVGLHYCIYPLRNICIAFVLQHRHHE